MQQIFANLHNVLRTAASIVASSFIPSNYIPRVSASRQGGGQVKLTGDYTGNEDATFEVEVVNNTINGDPVVSEPSFSGVGNGDMSAIAATSAIDAQTITVTLVDLGTRTTFARAPFGPVTLRAADSGPSGNGIVISVDRSGLTFVESDFAVPDDMSIAEDEFIGEQWNFGAATLNEDGTVPESAPRLRFGHGPTIYRQYRRYIDGQYVYSFSPALREQVGAGTKVFIVTGHYALTVTDGLTPENYPSVVTLFDFLSGAEGSALLNIDGVVSRDLTPGGMGVTDLNLFTAPYVRRVGFDGSQYVRAIDNLSALAAANSESVNITCINNTVVGQEQWEVEGTVSGLVGRATTGEAFAAGPLAFTIPPAIIPSGQPNGVISVRLEPVSRSSGETLPALCEDKIDALLGARARNGTWTFTYEPRPDIADCAALEALGSPDKKCLGTEVPNVLITSLKPPIRRRAESVERWIADAYAEEFRITRLARNNGEVDRLPALLNRHDREVFEAYHDAALQCLADLNDQGELDADIEQWATGVAIAADEYRIPTTPSAFRFRAQNAGNTGGAEPVWPTTAGGTVVDNGITWEAVQLPLALFDAEVQNIQADLAYLLGTTAALSALPWQPNRSYTATAVVVPSSRNGHLYTSTNIGDSGATEPIWPTDGGTILDGTITWLDSGAYWTLSQDVVASEVINPHPAGGFSWRAKADGTTGVTEPDWDSLGETIVDGSVEWIRVSPPITFSMTDLVTGTAFEVSGAETVGALMRERFGQQFDAVRIAAGILNFDQAGAAGGRCWRDHGDMSWWASNNGLLPAFANHYYHSARRRIDEDGSEVIESTQEFGFRPAVAGGLKHGDRIVVEITNVNGLVSTYQPSDRISVDTVKAGPVQFSGGQTGNDTLTWSVIGSSAFANYDLLITAPAAYSDSGLSFLIDPGNLEFALGDRFVFDVEGGQFRWRKDSGAWSADIDIEQNVGLSDGVVALFERGSAPSFVPGDTYVFNAQSINGPTHLIQPTDDRMSWESGTSITIESGQPVSHLFLTHNIPSTAVITLEGSNDDFASSPLNQTVAWNESIIVHSIGMQIYAKYRLSVSTGGSIQWMWLGLPWSSAFPGTFIRRHDFEFVGTGINQEGRFLGEGVGGSLRWSPDEKSKLEWSEALSLKHALRHAFEFDQKRVGLLAQPNSQDEGMLVFIAGNRAEMTDLRRFQPSDKEHRIISLELELEGVV